MLKDLSKSADVVGEEIRTIDTVVAGWNLGPGESSVLSLALEKER